jgi:hypothetical protein
MGGIIQKSRMSDFRPALITNGPWDSGHIALPLKKISELSYKIIGKTEKVNSS